VSAKRKFSKETGREVSKGAPRYGEHPVASGCGLNCETIVQDSTPFLSAPHKL
jgi:hypothetical protein